MKTTMRMDKFNTSNHSLLFNLMLLINLINFIPIIQHRHEI